MKLRLLWFIVALFAGLPFCSYAQDEKAIETTLRNCYSISQIRNDSLALAAVLSDNLKYAKQRMDSRDTIPPHEVLFKQDTTFISRLLYYTGKVPATLHMQFNTLHQRDVNIMSSDDSIFRIYTWKQTYSSYRRGAATVFQFKAGSNVKACTLPHSDTALTGSSQAFYDAVYTLPTKTKTYYLASYINKYATTMREEGIKVFCIDSGKVKGKMQYWLNDTVHIILTKSGLHNELSYRYDVVASGDAASDNGVSFDSASQSIEIPVITSSGKMTESHIRYQFKGQYFERVEEDKPKKKLRIKN